MIEYLIASILPSQRTKLVIKEIRRLGAKNPKLLVEACRAAHIRTVGHQYLSTYDVEIYVDSGSIFEEVISTGSFQVGLMRELAERITLQGLLFVNVGANMGTTCLNAHSVGFRDFIAFEPVHSNFHLLEKNLALLDGTIKLHMKAAGSAPGRAQIHINPKSIGRHSLIKDFGRGTEEIEIVRLDDVLPRRPGILWIDTEGYELNVLRGAEDYIRDFARALCVEVTPNLLGADLQDLLSLLKRYFSRFYLNHGVEVPADQLNTTLFSKQLDIIALK